MMEVARLQLLGELLVGGEVGGHSVRVDEWHGRHVFRGVSVVFIS